MWRKSVEPKAPLSPDESAAPVPAPMPHRQEEIPVETSNEASRVTRNITIKGEIEGSAELFLDGRVEGKIHLNGACLTIGPNGHVRADVRANEIIVEGRIEGALEARERVLLRRSGNVTGNITAPRVAIEEGAILKGRIEMPQLGNTRAVAKAGAVTRTEALRPVTLEAGN